MQTLDVSSWTLSRTVAAGAALLALALVAPGWGQTPAGRRLRFGAVVDGTGEQALRWPVAVTAGPADEIAIADAWKSRLLVFRRVGAGWATASEISLPSPPVAVVHLGARYLVGLRGSSRLLAVEVSGGEATAREVALPDGILPGRLAAASDGALLAWDSRRGRVVKLRDGEIAVQVGFDASVTALAGDATGGFWAAIGERGELHHFDGAGQRLAVLRLTSDGPVPAWPAGIATDAAGALYVVDRHAHRVLELDGDGRTVGSGSGKGWEPGLLLFPNGVALLSGGGLLVGDEGNGRAQVFELAGAGTR